GDTLTGSYTYADAESDTEGTSTFRWLRDGTAIGSATGTAYTTVAADAGKAITFEVTPVAQVGTSPGATVTSSVINVVAANAAPTATNVAITDNNGGNGEVGDTLTGSYTYADAESDTEGTSTFRWLRDGTAIGSATGTTYTTVAADAGKAITFEVTPVAAAGTSPGAAVVSTAINVTTPPANVTISGKVTFDRVPTGATGTGLNYSAIAISPVRKATLQALSSTNAVIATTTTDDNGDYSLTVAANADIKIRVRAEMTVYSVTVVDNTSSNALYVMDGSSASSGAVNSTRNLHAASGWGGSSYTSTRIAAPFAILDSMFLASEKIKAVDAGATFAQLVVNWSINNVPSGGNKALGQIGTSHYDGNGNLFILGKENNDTDEYDDHVMLHEWAHYFEDKFSRSDSIGGGHSDGNILDMRVAFGEGFGNAMSGILTDDPAYKDTTGPQQGQSFELNVENSTPKNNPGFYSESSVQRILYDLYDANADDAADTAALGFAPIYSVMVGAEKNAQAYTSIYTFITALKAANAGQATAIDSVVSGENIQIITDIFGSGETDNRSGNIHVLPIYSVLTVGGTTVNLCSVNDFGTSNRLSNRRFLRFTIATTGSYKVRAVRTSGKNPADIDFNVIQASNFTRVMRGFTATQNSEEATTNLAAGDHVMEIWEASNNSSPGEDTCFDINLTVAP
ncbi:MAG: hypothetical protein V3U84_05560, partial [Thiotrichaceae bacterium]